MGGYKAYGLGISSEIPLEELTPYEGVPDVTVKLASIVPPRSVRLEGTCFTASENEVHLFWEEVGSFLVRDGREILVEPAPGVEDRTLRSFLLGTVFGVVLHSQGLLVLHGSAVAVRGSAVTFLGGPGWGKSTLAASLCARGHRMVTDDIAAVRLDGCRPTLVPGFPQFKLWPEAALSLGVDPIDLPRLTASAEKRACRVADAFHASPIPLEHIFVLDRETGAAPARLTAAEAMVELVRHSYCAKLLPGGNAGLHFEQCSRLATSIPVSRLPVPALESLPDVLDAIEDGLAGAA